jgi:hypothetical protein
MKKNLYLHKSDRLKLATRPEQGDYLSMRVVAILRDKNGWMAYMGPAESSDEQIADWGEKLPPRVAEFLFPSLRDQGLQYRGDVGDKY